MPTPRTLIGALAAVAILVACRDAPVEHARPAAPVATTATASPAEPTPAPLAQRDATRGIARAPAGAVAAEVVRVVDGDTLRVTIDGAEYLVRLVLVNTPEVYPEVACFGPEASAFMTDLVREGSVVYLERDVSNVDRYDRLLRYVYRGDGQMVNEVLVRGGFAAVATYPPDLKYLDRLKAAERGAASAGRGLWSACDGG
ncbi:MAG: thermonuclease family protein [Dehalococcoidia bacterium]|nr:thermonuclease family protein [Dehalococcoidia bacterium]